MVIVDSSVWIDYLNRRHTPETHWLSGPSSIRAVVLPTLVLAEVLQGIRHNSRFRQAEQFFRTLPVVDSFDYSMTVQAAVNFRTLRALGVTIRSTVDCLIATFCIENGHQLLHCDGDYDYFERHLSLTVLHPPPLPVP
ncbi:MAG: PIN domain nuclease [Terracidiphilus sp.]|nr:PIN domain nuclease [Terracidiphilus sp.]